MHIHMLVTTRITYTHPIHEVQRFSQNIEFHCIDT